MKKKSLTLITLFLMCMSMQVIGNKPLLNVKDYGAVGDGITDDGPAIDAAFTEATNFGGNAIVAFEKKTYYIGEKEAEWHYFNFYNLDGLVIEGNGAELVFNRTNQPFDFNHCSNITVRNLFVDFNEPTFFQGKVIAKNLQENSFDAIKQKGYPGPPLGTNVSGGGGFFGQVWEPVEYFRKKSISQDFFRCASITKLNDSTYRFLMDSPHYVQIPLIELNDRITYGLSTTHIDATVKAKKEGKSGGAVYISKCSDILFEDFTLYGAFAMGFMINNSNGPTTLRRVNIKRRPGTDRLLALPSDGIHTDNNRGAIIIENCYLESCADDMLSLHSKEEKIIKKNNETTFEIKSTDSEGVCNVIKVNDELMFIDRTSSAVLGNAFVASVVTDSLRCVHLITLNKNVPNIDIGITAFNLSSATPNTIIRNNTINITRRFAMLLRLIGATIDNNIITGYGGSMGIELLDQTNTGPFSKNYTITNNTFSNLNNIVISVGSTFPIAKDMQLAGNILIEGNTFNCNNPTAIKLLNTNDVVIRNNNITMQNINIGIVGNAISGRNLKNVTIDGLTLTDKRTGIADNTAMRFVNCDEETFTMTNLNFSLTPGMSNYKFLKTPTAYFVRPVGDNQSWENMEDILPEQIITSTSPVVTPTNTYYYARGNYLKSDISLTSGKIYGGFSGKESRIDLDARELADKDGNGLIEPWEFANETLIKGTAPFQGSGSSLSRFLTVTGGEVNGLTFLDHFYNSETSSGTIILGAVSTSPTSEQNLFSNAGRMINCTVRKVKAAKIPIMMTNKLSLIDNCLIEECISTSNSGVAAVFINYFGGRVCNSILRNNYNAGSLGGAVFANSLTSTDMNAIVENCVIYNNTAKYGGAIRAEAKTDKRGIQIINCTMVNNKSTTATVASVDLISGGLIVNSIVLDDVENEIRANTSNHYVSNNAFGTLALGVGVTAYPNTEMISNKTVADFGFSSPTTFQGAMITGDANFDQAKYDAIRTANYKINQPNSIGLTIPGLKELPSSYLVAGTGASVSLTATIPSTDVNGVNRPISGLGNVSLGAYQYSNPTDLKSKIESSFQVYPTNGGVRICGAEGNKINIYSISGQLIKSTIGMSTNIVMAVPKGLYIVAAGSEKKIITVK